MGLTSALMFCVSLILRILSAPFDRRLVAMNLLASVWASLYTWCMPLWSVKIKGRHKLDLKKNYVLVCNHQSQLDILVVYRLFFPFRWVSKAEVFHLPFIGWNMWLNGYIKLKRGDKESIRQMMDECESMLAKGISVFFFPEGTRSKTGRVAAFRPGAFILAKKMKISILPIVINGAKDALPKKSLLFHGEHKIHLKVLDEIPYNDFADKTDEETGEMVRNIMVQHIYEHMEIKEK